MPINLSDRLYIDTSVDAATEANRPRIGCHNVFAEGTLAASTTATTSFAENVADNNTFDFWKPTALPATLTVTLSTAQDVDYMGIAGHNLLDGSCTITAQYYDGAAWQNCHTAVTPTNNKDFMVVFDSVSSTQFRLSITGTLTPIISVAHIGQALKFPKNFYQGHAPINLSRKSTILKNVSDGGFDLGVSHLRSGASTQVEINNIDKGWIRSNLETFNTDALTKAFFFAWRPNDFSADVGYCWLNRDATASNTDYPDLMNLQMSIDAHVELGDEVIPYNIDCFSGYIDRYVSGSDNPEGWIYYLPGQDLVVTNGSGNSVAFCETNYLGTEGNIQFSHRSGNGPGHSGLCGLLAPDGVTLFTAGRNSAWWNLSWFAIWDLTDPNSPVLKGTFGSPDGWFYYCGEMAYDSVNELLFVTSGTSDAVSIIDVSDLDNPVKDEQILGSTESPNAFDYATGIAYYDGHIFVAGNAGNTFAAVDVASPTRAIVDVLYADTDPDVDLEKPWFVWVYEAAELAYVGSLGSASVDGYLTVFDISDPTNISQVFTSSFDGRLIEPGKMVFDETNEILYIADNTVSDQKVVAISLIEPRTPVYLNQLGMYSESNDTLRSTWALDLDTTNNIIYVSGYYHWQSFQIQSCGCVTA